MNLEIKTDGSIRTVLYKSQMALCMLVLPNFMHPPGVLNSYIYGNVLRILRLNTDDNYIIADTVGFLNRFAVSGHLHTYLKPIFLQTITNASEFVARSDNQHAAIKAANVEAASRRLYFHVVFHDQNPPAHKIQ